MRRLHIDILYTDTHRFIYTHTQMKKKKKKKKESEKKKDTESPRWGRQAGSPPTGDSSYCPSSWSPYHME